jgi:hypothetical protein
MAQHACRDDIALVAAALDAAVSHLVRSSALPDPDVASPEADGEHYVSHIECLGRVSAATKTLRNACASGSAAQTEIADLALPSLQRFLLWDIGHATGGPGWEAALAGARRLVWQCFANLSAGNAACKVLWWAAVATNPHVVEASLLAARSDDALAGIVAHVFFNAICSQTDADAVAASAHLVQLSGDKRLLRNLISLAQSSTAAVEWLGLIIEQFGSAGLIRQLIAAAVSGVPLVKLRSRRREPSTPEETTECSTTVPTPVAPVFTAELLLLIRLFQTADSAEKLLSAVNFNDGAAHAALDDFGALVELLDSFCSAAVKISMASSPLSSCSDSSASARELLALPAVLAAADGIADNISDALAACDAPCSSQCRDTTTRPASLVSAPSSIATAARSSLCFALYEVISLLHALTPIQITPLPARSARETAAAAADADLLVSAPLSAAIPTAPPGLRASLCRLIALACYRDKGAATVVRESRVMLSPACGVANDGSTATSMRSERGFVSGVFIMLNQCTMDAANPTLREWALLAVKHMCDALPETIPSDIERLKSGRIADAPELQALGVTAASTTVGEPL